ALACRDSEQAAAIRASGRNPRYLTRADLTGVTPSSIAGAPIEEADLVAVAVPSASFGEGVAALSGEAPVLSLTKGLDPAARQPPLHAGPRPPGRRAFRPQHRRRDRAWPARCRRRREWRSRADLDASAGDQLDRVPRLRERGRRRRRAVRGREERDRARGRRGRRARTRRQREGGAR